MKKEQQNAPYPHPSGGWGSVKEVATVLLDQHVPFKGPSVLLHQNKTEGFACVGCAWAKPANPHPFEFCESGAKATAWEITNSRVTPDFFLEHTVAQLLDWSDHQLEAAGRLTVPLRWDAASDRYLEVDWEVAFAEIGHELRQLEPRQAVFYSSGRASLETSYMYQLMARLYGCNNLPDSSNMCHESTAVALPETIGVGVGTVSLADFEATDCIFFFGQNVGTNSPRMLHQLQEARQRGVPIVTFNPLREPGLVSFVNPQSPVEMLTPRETTISTQYHQLKAGGDSAAVMGICKVLLEDALQDMDFIGSHCHGFEAFADAARQTEWADIVRESGLEQQAIRDAAQVYGAAERVICVYGMGLTQHRHGVQNVQMLTNLLLLRGNIGKPGAGICPVRGHSNVQGQRTVGITEKPELAPLDKLAALYHFEPPRDTGLNTVDTCTGVLDGSVKAFVGLGGNFVRAVPETLAVERAWQDLRLTVQISTKLNRSHLVHGAVSYILPCLGRIEIDRQAGGEQSVSVEDSTGHMHGSRGRAEPASAALRSEQSIIASLALALLPSNPAVPWAAWGADYSLVREAIARTYPEIFADFNARMWQPGGFRKAIPAAERVWKTKTGKANFMVPATLREDPDQAPIGGPVLRLFTMRSDGQFNTTVYSEDDRFRGIKGNRRVLLANAADLDRLGLRPGQAVDVSAVAGDDVKRELRGFILVDYDVPAGCIAGYFPECNPIIPLWHHDSRSKVPAAKSISVTLLPSMSRN